MSISERSSSDTEKLQLVKNTITGNIFPMMVTNHPLPPNTVLVPEDTVFTTEEGRHALTTLLDMRSMLGDYRDDIFNIVFPKATPETIPLNIVQYYCENPNCEFEPLSVYALSNTVSNWTNNMDLVVGYTNGKPSFTLTDMTVDMYTLNLSYNLNGYWEADTGEIEGSVPRTSWLSAIFALRGFLATTGFNISTMTKIKHLNTEVEINF